MTYLTNAVNIKHIESREAANIPSHAPKKEEKMSYYSTITDVELDIKLGWAETPILKEEWYEFHNKAVSDKENFVFYALEVDVSFSPEGELEEILFGTGETEGKVYNIKEDLLLLKNLFDKHKIPFRFTIRVDGEDGCDVAKYQISSKEKNVMISQVELVFSDFAPMD